MREAVTISLPKKLKKDLDKLVKEEGVSRSDIVRESLRNYLFIRRFRRIRREIMADMEKRGVVLTEQEIFDTVS